VSAYEPFQGYTGFDHRGASVAFELADDGVEVVLALRYRIKRGRRRRR
jgi:hypothetical protein